MGRGERTEDEETELPAVLAASSLPDAFDGFEVTNFTVNEAEIVARLKISGIDDAEVLRATFQTGLLVRPTPFGTLLSEYGAVPGGRSVCTTEHCYCQATVCPFARAWNALGETRLGVRVHSAAEELAASWTRIPPNPAALYYAAGNESLKLVRVDAELYAGAFTSETEEQYCVITAGACTPHPRGCHATLAARAIEAQALSTVTSMPAQLAGVGRALFEDTPLPRSAPLVGELASIGLRFGYAPDLLDLVLSLYVGDAKTFPASILPLYNATSSTCLLCAKLNLDSGCPHSSLRQFAQKVTASMGTAVSYEGLLLDPKRKVGDRSGPRRR